MNINTMNDSAVTKALNARIKAKGCSFGSMTLKQKIVFNAIVQEEIFIDYIDEDYAHPRITRAKNK